MPAKIIQLTLVKNQLRKYFLQQSPLSQPDTSVTFGFEGTSMILVCWAL
jgi:hypothetical protein